jgi:hypothetical protein
VFTGSPGEHLETIRGFKMICVAGECDHLPEQAFMVSTIDGLSKAEGPKPGRRAHHLASVLSALKSRSCVELHSSLPGETGRLGGLRRTALSTRIKPGAVRIQKKPTVQSSS